MKTIEKNSLRFNNDRAHHYLEIEWRSVPAFSEFKEGSERSIRLIRKTRSTGCLADVTNLKEIFSAEKEWIDQQLIPIVLKSGLERIALLTVSDIAANGEENKILGMPDSIKTKYFTNRPAAIQWLESNSN